MKNSPRLFLAVIVAAVSVSTTFAVNPVVQTNTPGPTTFISNVTLGNISTNLSSIVFSILPMHGATAKPISATYSKAYLARTNRLNTTNGTATIPVFGLYQNYTNSVVITCIQGGAATTQVTSIKTPAWTDPDGYLSQLTVYIPRKPSVSLGYSFMEMKYTASGITPVILDTDGEIRWVGTANHPTQSSIFYQNSFFLGTGTKLTRMELDGSTNTIADYSTNYGVTSTQHHTYDPGKTGILLEVSTTSYLESSILEVSTNGTVLNNFDFAAIISSAMTNGGDVATNFVRPASNASPDWFHNNAATYWRAQDTLVVSSRENFVMGISYTTKKILWILGDTTKAWYQYPSLRAYALTLSPGSNPPIGEHGISITSDGQLMLFDNGEASFNQSPAGVQRNYSAPRKYTIDPVHMTATETWNKNLGPGFFSPITSCIYQDGNSYLLDYSAFGQNAALTQPIGSVLTVIFGMDSSYNFAFEYAFPGGYTTSWNTIPIHLESVVYQ